MRRFWNLIRSKSSREALGWLGGGAIVVIAGLWTAFTYFYPPGKDGGRASVKIEANCGSVGISGNVSGATIVAGSPAGADCAAKPK